MQYLKPCEFDFIPHWTIEDKKYVAAFFYKLKRYYYHIEFDEFVAYLKYRIFLEYKKNKQIKVCPSLLGKLRMNLYRMNKRRINDIQSLSGSYIFDSIDLSDENPINLNFTIKDIEKICCKKTSEALLKKINNEILSSNEYKLLKKNKEKIIEYINL
ncbi:MAG: hypothetical protein PHE16_09885 [Aliarcobacter sp.]|nr:hypothetical protein [Aliarcobacter sp.]